jgi:hypothetical protein
VFLSGRVYARLAIAGFSRLVGGERPTCVMGSTEQSRAALRGIAVWSTRSLFRYFAKRLNDEIYSSAGDAFAHVAVREYFDLDDQEALEYCDVGGSTTKASTPSGSIERGAAGRRRAGEMGRWEVGQCRCSAAGGGWSPLAAAPK